VSTLPDPLPECIERDLAGRHPATVQILRWFSADHLPEGPIQELSSIVGNHAHYVAGILPDGLELTTGLRKLLEAKDCFVRAAIAAQREAAGE